MEKIFHKLQCMCHEVVVLTCTIHLCVKKCTWYVACVDTCMVVAQVWQQQIGCYRHFKWHTQAWSSQF